MKEIIKIIRCAITKSNRNFLINVNTKYYKQKSCPTEEYPYRSVQIPSKFMYINKY